MPVELETRRCLLCGREFTCLSNRKQKFCSQLHRDLVHQYRRQGYAIADMEQRECRTCGKLFWTVRASPRDYCCYACMPKRSETRTCRECGREYVPHSREQHYCCEWCRNQARRKEREAEAEAPQEPKGEYAYSKGGRTSRVCHDCGKPTNDYRCPRCLRKWRRKNDVLGTADTDSSSAYRLLRPTKW